MPDVAFDPRASLALSDKVFSEGSAYAPLGNRPFLKVHPDLMHDMEEIIRTALPAACRRVIELEATLARLRLATLEFIGLGKEEIMLRKGLPAGTANAEDAWRDFGKKSDVVRAELLAILHPVKGGAA